MTTPESKTCTKCGETKPLSEYYVARHCSDGLYPSCKDCHKAAQKTYNRDPEKQRAQWKRSNAKTGAERKRRYRARHRERYLAAKKLYREKNRERLAVAWAEYYEAHRDELAAKRKAKYDPDKKRAERTPERNRIDRERRRARLLAAFVEDVPFDFILQRDLGICGICGKPIMEATIELDHILPLAAGGMHKRTNVQLAHLTCNRKKGARAA